MTHILLLFLVMFTTSPHIVHSTHDTAQKAFNLDAVTKHIHQANVTYGDRFTNNDSSFYASLYTTDACIMPEGTKMICGVPGIRKYYYNDGHSRGLSIAVTALEIIGGADAVVETGTFEIFGEGKKSLDKGKFMVAWKQEFGKWKIHKEIWNSDNPPAHNH